MQPWGMQRKAVFIVIFIPGKTLLAPATQKI